MCSLNESRAQHPAPRRHHSAFDSVSRLQGCFSVPPSEVELGKAQITASFSKSDSNGAEDQLLDEMLASSVHDRSCLSRYRSAPYRRESPYKPSADLVKSLRRYEALHKSCGPQTEAFEKSMLLLKNPHGGPSRCKYLVWTPENGLGNRMLSLASTFLYALLSDRVLLIDRGKDLDSLFCEPFPGSSWLLPPDFPLKFRAIFNKTHPHRFGNMLRSRSISDDVPQPAMVYAHLSHDYDDQDKRFYCEADQMLLHEVPWMVLRSDQYFVPALFLLPSFERRLHQLFPQKEAIFHHLGRYLFHPSNPVWDLIISYFEANLAGATETLGIQLRIYGSENPIINLVTRQILNCTWGEKLLPLPTGERLPGFSLGISFHQPSHEERQQTGREAHDAKALAEIFLLSTADTLVTSAWSTFGYVAQGLGGLTPWILRGPVHAAVPRPACVRATSMEPCFHFPPTTTAQQEGSLRRQRSSHTRPSAETEFRGCKW
ncbi:unnamed protein product [Spirodela intermedia]|uniref:Fucosyltransferase n=1 Tax=Spirodela intermedia TaxID=51605 RepID=A0A7I8JFG9_SPIIN|nr:unnamed protein product [Spirodela intermedia]CAA6668928.1 unnamed protein product [Spirodela intermedia]